LALAGFLSELSFFLEGKAWRRVLCLDFSEPEDLAMTAGIQDDGEVESLVDLLLDSLLVLSSISSALGAAALLQGVPLSGAMSLPTSARQTAAILAWLNSLDLEHVDSIHGLCDGSILFQVLSGVCVFCIFSHQVPVPPSLAVDLVAPGTE
jgi:hypothetical protein